MCCGRRASRHPCCGQKTRKARHAKWCPAQQTAQAGTVAGVLTTAQSLIATIRDQQQAQADGRYANGFHQQARAGEYSDDTQQQRPPHHGGAGYQNTPRTAPMMTPNTPQAGMNEKGGYFQEGVEPPAYRDVARNGSTAVRKEVKIPEGHPVRDMSEEEVLALVRAGMDPVVVAERRAVSGA
ncbi:MAG: hypothetical protein M1831_001530 [Alyxoria varia]|nr:MAG: hypothetical protein M1831_001530 [Alyxoria varia]